MKYFKFVNSLMFFLIATLLFSSCSENKSNRAEIDEDSIDNFFIGWASANITPDKPVLLRGQFYARISEGVKDPVTATALAIESGKGSSTEKVILISCDLVNISDDLRDAVREILTKSLPSLLPEQVVLNATHTHTGPQYSGQPNEASKEYPTNISGTTEIKSAVGVELDAMGFSECQAFISERIAKAAEQAWKNRKPGGISYGLGHAVVGHNRLIAYLRGKSKMYGNTNSTDFSHIEGFEDHSVNLLYTWDKKSKLTGVAINVPSPAQVSESGHLISADYWHDTRVELRKRLGKNLFVLPQCSAAGDQSPHIMVGKKAEYRMQRLIIGDSLQTGRGSMGRRKQIAIDISDAVTSVLPYMKSNIEWDPVFAHQAKTVELSRRLIGIEDVESALKEAEIWKNKYEKMLLEIGENPDIKQKPRWYRDITIAYRKMRRGYSVKERYDLEKVQPKLPIEIHVVRIGDMVIATNPFELYLDYGIRIKERSPAIQTFLVQLSGSGTYVPTKRSIAGGAYGAVPASTLIGPEGGQELVEKTLGMINSLFE
ncbi:MAG: hypothetical protein L3J11_11000 [Draconibacterium sp.]|nr:hypothetical protein [Draconibacterium sp.]